ncbi:carbohydrate ABC transporter permease [Paenibacillus cymbidii]|uniref:carbohydrate ABC transporter permease n=1 Tax=Paenibacillus cymbidii TaxID=1639034 RepID=UPI00108086C8|nr:carbohydrate ABC transporter permease [Paenibacillus cymbidii]
MFYKQSWGERLFDWLIYACMLVIFAVMVTPFLHIVNYSLSLPTKATGQLLLVPKGFTLDAYKAVFTNKSILHSIWISVARTVSGTALMAFITSMGAYAISRDDLFGAKFWRKYFVFTLYFSGGIIPVYLLIRSLGLAGTFWVYIVPGAVSVFNMILIKTYMESIPKELEESARMDGANDVFLFFRIVFPLSVPVLAAVSLFSGIGQWNAFIDTQFYNAMNPNLFPLQYVLYNALQSITSVDAFFHDSAQVIVHLTPQSLKLAMTVLTVVPIMIVYPLLQKYFIKGLLVGSIKG